jgi:methionyl aminopeptidase
VIVCKSAAELEKMLAANQLVARVLEALRPLVVPGATTAQIDAMAEKLVRDAGAEPAFKGYRGFPATVCTASPRDGPCTRGTSSRWTWASSWAASTATAP